MKILVVGGGSGGHITPAVAVIREILELKPRTEVEFWTDFKYHKNVTKLTTEIGVSWGEERNKKKKKGPYIRVRRILSGKFHRYAGWKFSDYFVHIDITLKDLIFGNIFFKNCFIRIYFVPLMNSLLFHVFYCCREYRIYFFYLIFISLRVIQT